MNRRRFHHSGFWFRLFPLALLCSAFFIFSFLAPAMATAAVTGVTVSSATANLNAGQAVYAKATVQGTGDLDHRVNWSLSPGQCRQCQPHRVVHLRSHLHRHRHGDGHQRGKPIF